MARDHKALLDAVRKIDRPADGLRRVCQKCGTVIRDTDKTYWLWRKVGKGAYLLCPDCAESVGEGVETE